MNYHGWRTNRSYWIVAGLCLAVAIIVRAWVFVDVKALPDVTSDGVFYQEVAQKIAEGTYWKERNAFDFSPLYVFYLAAVRQVTGGGINAVRILQLIMGPGSGVLIFLVARKVLSQRAALIAFCLASLYLPFVFFEIQILGVTLVLFLMLLSLYLLVTAIGRGSRVLLAFAGWTLGLASLGAPNLILMTAPVAAWLLFFAGRTQEISPRGWKPGGSDIARAAIFVGTVACGILPVTIWNYHASGEVIPISSQGGINFYIGNNPHATGYFTAPPGMEDSLIGINIKDSRRIAEAEAGHPLEVNEVSAYWFGKGLHYVASDPAGFARLMFRKAFIYLNHYETPLDVDFDSFKTYSPALGLPLVHFGVIAILGLAGFLLACRQFGRYSLLILLFATCSATVVAFFVSDRYRLPAVPFFIFFSALGIDWAWEQVQEGKPVPAALGAALLLPIGFFVYQPVGFKASPSSLYFNLAAAYIKQDDLPKAKAELEKCLKVDPDWVEARYDLATVDDELHDNDGAWEQLAMLGQDGSADVQCLRGQIHADSGLLASAREIFNTVISLDPNRDDARRKLAGVQALITAETPEARRERGARIQQDVGQRLRSGQHERAIADLSELRAGQFEGINMAFIDTGLGFEYTRMGRYDDAEKSFEAALLLNPGNAIINKNLTILEIKRGNRLKAQYYFQQFSRLAPNDPQVATVRDQLSQMP